MSRVWIRADGGPGIGAGHLMRCLSVARAAEAFGVGAAFLVAGPESAALIAPSGVEVVQMGGDPFSLQSEDAAGVLELANPGDIVLVDSYAVSEGFFGALAGRGLTVAYVDDRYLFAEGALGRPACWNVDVIIDYGFDAEGVGYADVYGGTGTGLLLGPAFAPLRDGFRVARNRRDATGTSGVLITCGSTNPARALERMVEGCLSACDMPLNVVVGGAADFDWRERPLGRINIHRGVHDLAPLMERSAIAVSAAGSTLYELSCVGVPTVACPIVENQKGNVAGFVASDLGIALGAGWTAADVGNAVFEMTRDVSLGVRYSEAMLKAVDGHGADRIVRSLIDHSAP